VDEHWGVVITLREQLRDVPEMAAYFIAAFGIPRVVGADVDHAAVVVQLEMMSGLLVGEPHYVVPVFVDLRLMILGERQRSP
jgi:hypothetical protein